MTSPSLPLDPVVTAQSVVPRDIRRPAFLVGAWIDAIGVLGGGVLLSICLYLAWRLNAGFVLAATLFAMISDLPHVLQTSARIWLDPQERRLHARNYLVSLGAFALFISAMIAVNRLNVLLVVWVCWQFIHVLKQHYGMLSIYATKDGYRDDRRLAKYSLILGCVAPVLYRLRIGMRFSDYTLFGRHMPFSNLALPVVPLPAWTILAVYAAFLCVFVMLMRQQFGIVHSGKRPIPVMAWATLGVAVVSYNLAYLFVSDLYALILIATAIHSLQYHLISWRRNFGRFSNPPGGETRLLLARLSQKNAVAAYTVFFIVLGIILANGESVLLGAIPLTFVLHHFYMDGFIWKGKQNPRLAADLGLFESSAHR
jgi:hypothetical protein